MTVEELQQRMPEKFQPWVATYGPAFLAMTAEELKAWIDRLLKGDGLGAYQEVLAKLPNAGLLDEWNTINAQWQAANEANVERMALQKAAAMAVAKILLGIALAAAGF